MSSTGRVLGTSLQLGYRHQKVQRLRKLLRRRAMRESEGVFVVEGQKLIDEAIAQGIEVESVFAAPTSNPELLDRLYNSGTRVHLLEPGVMEKIADTVSPQPVCAIVPIKQSPINALSNTQSIVVLVDVRDPGNAGTIMRSAEASGLEAVVFAGNSVDVWNPKTVRSSAGSIFHLQIAVDGDTSSVFDQLKLQGFSLAATTMTGGSEYDRANLNRKMAFVFGNEANGLPPALIEALDETLSIPISGRSESLNVSMAASILCFEAARQRRLGSGDI